MKHIFTFKSMFIALLVMICSTVKADIVEYKNNGFRYWLDTETLEASLSEYSGYATEVVIPEKVTYKREEYKVTSLGGSCFSRCSSLVSIEIPSSVTSLGESCFWDCSSLVSIEIPASVTSLEWGCFRDCSSLASIVIPASVTSLGGYCFDGCSSLASIVIPASITSLESSCFWNCSSLGSIVVDAENPHYDSREGCNAIIETESNTMVVGCENTVIPSSVTSLGNGCFDGRSSLVSIVIPSSVKWLEGGCFDGCSSLESIVVDAQNPRYDSREGCNAIIETESNTMVVGCENTVIPSSVTSLGNYCFAGRSSLKSIDIPSSVTSLGGSCFNGCSSLESIDIPSSVTSLGDWCFTGCSSLKSIDIPSSVTSLGGYCFFGCSSLESIDIPSSVTSLGGGCFRDCSSLLSIDIPSSVTSLEEQCFYLCSSLKSVGIPSSVTSLGEHCFGNCSSLASIDIPSSVTSLGICCFNDCVSLKSIVIPSSVTSLGSSCFYNCSSLKTVICKMENVVNGDFFSCWQGDPIRTATLYVPEHLLEAYKSTEPWSNFGTILPWTEELEMGVNDIAKSDLSLRSSNGNVVLSSLTDGTPVSCYSTEGRLLGKTIVNNGSASFSVKPNSIVIVKAGRQSVKVHVK